MLTEAEQAAARTAPYRGGVGHGYGTPAVGYCPIGAVAVLRGMQFDVDADGEYSSYRVWLRDARGRKRWEGARADLHRATEDLLAWSGYATLSAFLHAWEVHGAACLPGE